MVAGAGAMGCLFGAALFQPATMWCCSTGGGACGRDQPGRAGGHQRGRHQYDRRARRGSSPSAPRRPFDAGRPGYRVRQGDGDRGGGRRRGRGWRDRARHPCSTPGERPRQHRGAARLRAREDGFSPARPPWARAWNGAIRALGSGETVLGPLPVRSLLAEAGTWADGERIARALGAEAGIPARTSLTRSRRLAKGRIQLRDGSLCSIASIRSPRSPVTTGSTRRRVRPRRSRPSPGPRAWSWIGRRRCGSTTAQVRTRLCPATDLVFNAGGPDEWLLATRYRGPERRDRGGARSSSESPRR